MVDLITAGYVEMFLAGIVELELCQNNNVSNSNNETCHPL